MNRERPHADPVGHPLITLRNHSSSSPLIRVSIHRKLMVAFVLVSLIGFVAAVVVLPRLFVLAYNRQIEGTFAPNSQILRTRFYAEVYRFETVYPVAEPLKETAAYLGAMIGSATSASPSADFKAAWGSNPIDLVTLFDRLADWGASPQLEEYFSTVQPLTLQFDILRVLPRKVLPLAEHLSVWSEGGSYYLPLLEPIVFQVGDEEVQWTLLAARHKREPLAFSGDEFTSEEITRELAKVGLSSATEVAYFPVPEIIDESTESLKTASDIIFYNEEDLEAAAELKSEAGAMVDAPFFEREAEAVKRFQRRIYVPVENLSEPGEIAGLFLISYPPPRWQMAFQELASTPSYTAVGLAALLAIILSYFFALGITRPIQALTEGAIDIAQGRLERRVTVSTADEIGVLADTFNEMTDRLQRTLQELRERAETIETQNAELDRRFNQLNVLQNYTENVLSTVDSAIFSVDPSGRIRRPNRAAQFLLGLEDGCLIEDLDSEDLRDRLQSVLEGGDSVVSEEITVRSPLEECIPAALSVSPLEESDSVAGAVAVLTDLQAIKNLEALVSRQERLAALGQLTAGVAHEIRNPLSIIKACAEILRQRFESSPGEDGLCRDIIEEVDRLSRVVSEFLTFARPTQPRPRPVALNELLARTLDLVERGESSGLEFVREFDPDLPPVSADTDQIEQVLLNLIRNGVEAMQSSGILRVRTGLAAERGVAFFEVKDSGEGMSEETRRKIFDPFYTTKASGTGLGLSICHRIVEAHGGGIEITQTGPGEGTTIRVTLPVYEDEELSAQMPMGTLRENRE